MRKIILTLIASAIITGCGGSNDNPQENVTKPSVEIVNETLVENKKISISPVVIPNNLNSFSWKQTCGTINVLNDSDKESTSFIFTAPESFKDEQYCFKFNGVDSSGAVYTTEYNVSVIAPTLEIYLDHASLPSLNQLMHMMSTHEENEERKRFVSWARLSIDEQYILEKLNIEMIPLSGNNTSPKLIEMLETEILSVNRLNVELFSNTLHSMPNLKPIINKISDLNENVTIKKIRLYDDGSADYVNLYNWKNTPNKIQNLEDDIEVTKDYLSGKSDKAPYYIHARYNWHKLYETEYLFLRPDYFSLEKDLNDMMNYLGSSLTASDWDRFNTLSEESKEMFLQVVGFDKKSIDDQYNASPNDNFVFTGTTTWGDGNDKDFFAQQQVNVINNAINETSPLYLGKDYDLFFKGHPRGGEINDKIIASFDNMQNIPASVSFEILMMTNSLPDKVAGIASSLYFTIPNENVGFIVFTSSDSVTDKEEAMKSPLVQVMLKLGIVKEDTVLFWSDLPNCSTGICIK
ncbi:PKD domain-containing protein [Enterovibrio baiacu]|uniref:PKD domain-containing protein n=1 Tax=Enterovibrio baiacu TaxID=2491023 RepID=UPI003D10854D